MIARKWLRLRFRLRRMMGAAQPRVIFLHIPKCGGTTISRHFKYNFGGGRSGLLCLLDSMDGTASAPAMIENAKRAQYVSGHFGWHTLQQIRGDAVCFTLVRDPYERLISFYKFAISLIGTPAGWPGLRADATFRDFLLFDDPKLQAYLDNAMTRTLAGDYYPLVPYDAEATLETAKENLSSLALVIDAVDLDEDFAVLAERTQTVCLNLGRINETPPQNLTVPTRAEFMAEPEFARRIALDSQLYQHALQLIAARKGQAMEPVPA